LKNHRQEREREREQGTATFSRPDLSRVIEMASDGHRVQSKDKKNREIGRLVASFAFLLVIAAEEGSMLPLLNILNNW